MEHSGACAPLCGSNYFFNFALAASQSALLISK
jgi:hypothetical protein